MKIKRILTPLLIILLLFSIVVMGAPTYVNLGPTSEIDGDIKITSEIVAEGTTANEFETTLVFTDPTADRIITFPDSNQTLDLSLYYLKTEIDIEAEMETIWGVGLAHSGANSDITSMTGLTTPLAANYGGTGIANNAAETITIGGAGTFPLTLTLTASTDVTLPTTGTLATTGKLSQFAATTSAELAGVISDEIGAGKARFDTSVTAKTTTATLTVAEAGTILVSAASAYTITLPTAVNNTGLTYHFIKTDANYNLITLDGNNTETLNYENSTGAPTLTYARLNTYCAEVTIVSDGANWQCINERLGQNGFCWVWLSIATDNIPADIFSRYDVTGITTNIGSNYVYSNWQAGNATSTSVGHLVNTSATFTAAMVGKRIHNTTDNTWTYITAYNSATDVTVKNDIFANTEAYELKYSEYRVPVSGYYIIDFNVMFYSGLTVNAMHIGAILANRASITQVVSYPTLTLHIMRCGQTTRIKLTKDDIVELSGYATGSETADLLYYAAEADGKVTTYLKIWLVEKD